MNLEKIRYQTRFSSKYSVAIHGGKLGEDFVKYILHRKKLSYLDLFFKTAVFKVGIDEIPEFDYFVPMSELLW